VLKRPGFLVRRLSLRLLASAFHLPVVLALRRAMQMKDGVVYHELLFTHWTGAKCPQGLNPHTKELIVPKLDSTCSCAKCFPSYPAASKSSGPDLSVQLRHGNGICGSQAICRAEGRAFGLVSSICVVHSLTEHNSGSSVGSFESHVFVSSTAAWYGRKLAPYRPRASRREF
jgi:hypothetical protein